MKKKIIKNIRVFVYAGLCILCAIILIPIIQKKLIKRRIISDMSSVYSDAKFVDVKWEDTPYSKQEMEDFYIWYGDGLPDEDLYAFMIMDSNENVAVGYSDKNGNVIFDSYAGYYYRKDMIDYFLETVDFENNLPNVHYYFTKRDPLTGSRYVLTRECATFEAYRKSSTIGFLDYDSGGYPSLRVCLEVTDEKTISKINDILKASNFDLYVEYDNVTGDFTTANEDADFEWDYPEFDEPYYPFGMNYNKAILGND